MKRRITPFVLFTLLLYNVSNAQQWSGSNAPTGTIYRSGNVGVGPETTVPGFASLYLNNSGGLYPSIFFKDGDALANQRIWAVMAQGNRLRIVSQPDNFSSVQDAFNINRSGVNISTVTFPNGNVVMGGSSLSGTYGTSGTLQIQSDDTAWLSMFSRSVSGSFNLSVGGSKVGFYSRVFPVTFYTSPTAAGGLVERMRITPTGEFAIGTTLANNPNNYLLAVNGKIGAKEVIVENTSSTWADYVFEKDYTLMPLNEVETFVRSNKHLPEIPSADEVKKSGHKLGEMDVLLLKKIEEMTLYIIEQEKRIKALEDQVQMSKK